jgi:hypothetical protein
VILPQQERVMSTLQLNEAISTDDISSWGRNERDLLLKATTNSGFAVFSEGVALGKVRELKKNRTHVKLCTTFPIQHQHPVSGSSKFGFLGGLFGLSIMSAAESVTDSTGTNLREALLGSLWNHVQDSDGVVGDNKKRDIVFRDPDYSIPKCLREGTRKSFPLSQHFKVLLKRVGAEISTEKYFGASFLEDDVITFLYEAARNSHEHAREDAERKAIEGIRGISIEKYKFASAAEVDARQKVPPLVRKYFHRALESSRHGMFLAFSITDLGLGIHNTLPALPQETPWDRLNRAFLPGQSRKPTGSDFNRGLGLKKMLDSARRLKAFLFVRSAELVGYIDFSVSDFYTAKSPVISPWPGSEPGTAGTSVSMLWPIADRARDFESFGVRDFV